MRLAPQETRTYFVTAVTASRRRLFQVTTNAVLLEQTLLDYHRQAKFLLHAWVIMPDHVHVLMTPAIDVSLEKAMQFIKGGFSFRLKSKPEVWTRGFNETQILTGEKFQACLHYIENNPVRKHLSSSLEMYPHSSASQGRPDPMPTHLGEIVRSVLSPTPSWRFDASLEQPHSRRARTRREQEPSGP